MKTNETYILSYIKGSLSISEMKECDILMASSSEFSAKVNQIKKTYQLFDNLEAQRNINTKIAWQKINRKIWQRKLKKITLNLIRIAATLLLPLFLIQQYVIQPLLKETPQKIITLHSALGSVTKIVLPDGSEVWLNSQSELSYPQKFTGKERTVQLIGEAYFKVTSDEKNRFNVITPNKNVVSAFGTEFNVNAYTEDSENTITLTKGHIDVSLNNLSNKHTLMQGQKAVINSKVNTISVSTADTHFETAWKDGKLIFRRENIENIAHSLARKYGVIINVEGDNSKDYQFTATFTDESIEDILELLKLSTSIDYFISKQEKLSDNTYSQEIITIICK